MIRSKVLQCKSLHFCSFTFLSAKYNWILLFLFSNSLSYFSFLLFSHCHCCSHAANTSTAFEWRKYLITSFLSSCRYRWRLFLTFRSRSIVNLNLCSNFWNWIFMNYIQMAQSRWNRSFHSYMATIHCVCLSLFLWKLFPLLRND